jgi:hypothetical protein
MDLVIGAILAVGVGLWATSIKLDRDRALYPTITVVIALLYILFAVMAKSQQAVMFESLVAFAFVAAATFGFRTSLWIVVGALAAHGLFDLVHGHLVSNPGVPPWWPAFCLAYDVTAAGYLAWLLYDQRVPARGNPGP